MDKSNAEVTSTGGKDKQKLIIVGVLGVLVIGIGAFQFMGGEPPKKPVAKKAATDAEAKKATESTEPVDEKKIDLGRLIAGTLPQRDPFRPVDIPAVPDPKPSGQPTEAAKPDAVAQTPPKPEPTRPRQPNMGSMRPPSMSGQAPMNPMAGLPPEGAIGGGPGVAIQSAAPLRQPGEPAYSVAGVVIGKEKMVVLQDDNGNQLQSGEIGELCIRGPQVMKGYWNRPEETAKVLMTDGWLRTGDIAKMDEKGFCYIVDRKKDMILVSGFNVYPNEIEDVVAQHPGVLEVAAVGVMDEKSGEAVKIVVVKKDPNLSADQLKEHCRNNLTGYKLPKYIEFRDALPKSNVGKILRRELRDAPPHRSTPS